MVGAPTKRAAEFIEANKNSPVVYGSGNPSQNRAYYRLKDGSRWRLTTKDCQSMPYPKWDIPEEVTQ